MIVKLLLGGVFISMCKFSRQCAFMKVTCHLADDFYCSTQMAGAVSLEQHGIKCLDERLDCVRLHLETPQFMFQSCPESHLWRLRYQHRVLITRRPLTEAVTGQIAWLRVFSHFVRLLQSITNFSCSPLVCFHTIFWLCWSASVINIWQQAFKCS